MKKYLFILAALAAFPANATDQCGVDVKVNGLVCDFCAQALEKTVGKRDEVDAIRVDLDNGMVHIGYKPGQSLSDETVRKLITDSGFAIESMQKGC